MSDSFATLTFERRVAAPVATLWEVWTAPAARAVWASPAPSVTVEFLEADTRVGGREISLCKVEGQPDTSCEAGWLALQPGRRSVNYEVISSQGVTQSAALVTAEFSGTGNESRIGVTVQLSSLSENMEDGYRQGFSAGLANLAGVAERTMVISRVIAAPRDVVWGAWLNPETLPQWWGPDGFSCRTQRIDLRAGGEWVFDMIGPDGTVYPNHHLYGEVRTGDRIGYTLLWGENGPKHADAWVQFEDEDGATRITLGMALSTAEEYRTARGFGAVELGLQTLGKLARFLGAP
ncbi:MAG: SRPBCC domain-containing protein [Hoeflea sp.]|uniref:SRPBCC family protein n=1 Tax=Hoeflea sp. TaxID=1940281 RepID=UPI001DEA2586|nr:SRPBCC family protein [Hoeflea sp.]MBU4529815.1 SRPBCC domain-containing protein [Alphaproteobacteria bacterium]MBU4547164.1 SRPBCC domain-containing protein [Alphaproteobacteria bacterium]MBU4548777.1 SRPBCC domain-containing protein [Alphaproteobacteria bacterium]MBV1722307.1 SRPBCC domain-containing protein [Hoeflea sp.]MBV1762536.1 SRPBCC domain-containing protein [Hoeflea sp.]